MGGRQGSLWGVSPLRRQGCWWTSTGRGSGPWDPTAPQDGGRRIVRTACEPPRPDGFRPSAPLRLTAWQAPALILLSRCVILKGEGLGCAEDPSWGSRRVRLAELGRWFFNIRHASQASSHLASVGCGESFLACRPEREKKRGPVVIGLSLLGASSPDSRNCDSDSARN